jgi:hypothetical protein
MRTIGTLVAAIVMAGSPSFAQSVGRARSPQEECPQGRQIRAQKSYPSTMTDCQILYADTAAENQRLRRGPATNPTAQQPIVPAPAVVKKEDPRKHEIDEDLKIGYATISFDDFELDARQLTVSERKVAIAGYVRRMGSVDTLFPTEMKAFYAQRMPTSQIPLLTDDSPRDIRAYFLKCSNSGSKFGCWTRVRGHVSVCSLTTFGQVIPKPCLVVDGGWTLKD